MKKWVIVIGILVLIVIVLGCWYFMRGEKSVEIAEMRSVKINGTNFVMDNKTFKFIGANIMSLIWYEESDLSVEKAIKAAKESGINVLRIYLCGDRFEGPFDSPSTVWAWQSSEETVVEMRSHFKDYLGIYNEYYFKQLDAILDTASNHGVYIIITLRDYNWEHDVYW